MYVVFSDAAKLHTAEVLLTATFIY